MMILKESVFLFTPAKLGILYGRSKPLRPGIDQRALFYDECRRPVARVCRRPRRPVARIFVVLFLEKCREMPTFALEKCKNPRSFALEKCNAKDTAT